MLTLLPERIDRAELVPSDAIVRMPSAGAGTPARAGGGVPAAVDRRSNSVAAGQTSVTGAGDDTQRRRRRRTREERRRDRAAGLGQHGQRLPRSIGSNPRAVETSPRDLGVNPRERRCGVRVTW
jgi:hypothetical protein